MDTNMQVKISIWVQPFNGMCFLSSNSHRWRFKFFGIQCCVAWYIVTNVSDEVPGSIFRVVWKSTRLESSVVLWEPQILQFTVLSLLIVGKYMPTSTVQDGIKYGYVLRIFSPLCHKLILNLIHLHDPVSCKWKKASFSTSRSQKWSKTL